MFRHHVHNFHSQLELLRKLRKLITILNAKMIHVPLSILLFNRVQKNSRVIAKLAFNLGQPIKQHTTNIIDQQKHLIFVYE